MVVTLTPSATSSSAKQARLRAPLRKAESRLGDEAPAQRARRQSRPLGPFLETSRVGKIGGQRVGDAHQPRVFGLGKSSDSAFDAASSSMMTSATRACRASSNAPVQLAARRTAARSKGVVRIARGCAGNPAHQLLCNEHAPAGKRTMRAHRMLAIRRHPYGVHRGGNPLLPAHADRRRAAQRAHQLPAHARARPLRATPRCVRFSRHQKGHVRRCEQFWTNQRNESWLEIRIEWHLYLRRPGTASLD